MDAAADEHELFDILTQNLVYSGADCDDDLPELDELFSQAPLPSDIEAAARSMAEFIGPGDPRYL